MENKPDYQIATPESVWAILQEIARSQEEANKLRKENEKILTEKFAETDRLIKESAADFDRRLKESERERKESAADFDRRMKKQEELAGSWAHNYGSFAEEYFFNSFKKGKQNFFGEKFDYIKKNAEPIIVKIKDEYDILLINGKSAAIIEVKFKAHLNDIPQVLKKAETFRANFPDYAHHQVYLGLASMSFYPELERECTRVGVAIVKQVGNTVVINDANLKAY